MNRTLTYMISSGEAGQRAGQYLRRRGFSSKLLTRLRQNSGCLSVNGEAVHMNILLSEGDRLTAVLPEEESSPKIPPVFLPLSVLYEDEDLIVINKPAGLPIHPSMENYYHSLANGLAWYYQSKGETFVFRCTNRLDRDTSGVTVVAKNALSASILSEMGARHELHREYLAIVRGRVFPTYGTIRAPLARVGDSIIERAVDYERGEPAVTHYQTLRYLPDKGEGHSLVSLVLETGRTHQIRVHMRHLGYPLIGDYLYNPDMQLIGRQALHSWRMTFLHPVTGRLFTFTAPLPEDMERIVTGSEQPLPQKVIDKAPKEEYD